VKRSLFEQYVDTAFPRGARLFGAGGGKREAADENPDEKVAGKRAAPVEGSLFHHDDQGAVVTTGKEGGMRNRMRRLQWKRRQ